MEHEVTLTQDNFSEEVEQFPGVVLVDFWATWCPPCKAMAPVIEKIAEQYAGNQQVKVAKLDVDANEELSARFNVRSIPTFLTFKGGKVAATEIGAMPGAKLTSHIEALLAASAQPEPAA